MRNLIITANDDGYDLKYFKTTCHGTEENEGSAFYGVFVEKHINGNLVEEMDSSPLTGSETLINKIIDQLAKNSVTPFALLEVLDEMEVLYQ